MIFKDYYKILGLENSKVSTSEIKTAYREQAKLYHPDVNAESSFSEERFKECQTEKENTIKFKCRRRNDVKEESKMDVLTNDFVMLE